LYWFEYTWGWGYSYLADPNSVNAGFGNTPPWGYFLRSNFTQAATRSNFAITISPPYFSVFHEILLLNGHRFRRL